MKIYSPAVRPGGQMVWVEDPKEVSPVPGSIVETWTRVLQITSNRLQCAFFLTFEEINTMAGSQILEPGIEVFPSDNCFERLHSEMSEWQKKKKGAFGFSLGMTHPQAAEFLPLLPFQYVICGGVFVCKFASTRDFF